MNEELEYLTQNYALFPDDGTDCVWSRTDCGVSYNTDGNKEDLENGCGDTYSDYARELGNSDSLVVFEIDDGSGGKYRMIFNKENEVK